MTKREEIFEHIGEHVITIVRSKSADSAGRMIGVDSMHIAASTRTAAREVFDAHPLESVMSAFIVDMDHPEEYWPVRPYEKSDEDSKSPSEQEDAAPDPLGVLGPHLTKKERAWLLRLIKLMESGPESLGDKVSLYCGGDRSFSLYDLRRYIETVGFHSGRDKPDLVRELECAGIESLDVKSPIQFESVCL